VAGFWKIRVGAFHEGIGIAMRELASHGIVSGLFAFVGFEGTFSPVGIVAKMIAGTIRHGGASLRLRAWIV